MRFHEMCDEHSRIFLSNRCDDNVQKLAASKTFEALITTQDGTTISRALVNVVIDQQIGQQISVRDLNMLKKGHTHPFTSRLTLSVKSFSSDVVLFVVPMT